MLKLSLKKKSIKFFLKWSPNKHPKDVNDPLINLIGVLI